jgi:hypothetical protein
MSKKIGSRRPGRRGDPAWTPFEERVPLFEPGQGDHWSTTPVQTWVNSRYQVTLYLMPPAPQRGGLPCAQLSIKRHDKRTVTNWRDLQRIKDEILGTSADAVQLFPTAARLVDTTNQYHLWALPNQHCFPVGFADGRMTDQDPEFQQAIAEAHAEARNLPGYSGPSPQPKREPHHTDVGLPEWGLAGEWWR